MRTLTDHKVNPANDRLEITAEDAPGAGGAHHRYVIQGFDPATNPSENPVSDTDELIVLFQNGPINEVGVNGVTHEALLVVIADRLRSFQSGPYRSPFNERALAHVEAALAELKARTTERMQRGVEGTHGV